MFYRGENFSKRISERSPMSKQLRDDDDDDTHSYTHEKQEASSYDVTPLILTISFRSTFPFSALTNIDREIFDRFSEVRDSLSISLS